jgi:hypothetical protein
MSAICHKGNKFINNIYFDGQMIYFDMQMFGVNEGERPESAGAAMR